MMEEPPPPTAAKTVNSYNTELSSPATFAWPLCWLSILVFKWNLGPSSVWSRQNPAKCLTSKVMLPKIKINFPNYITLSSFAEIGQEELRSKILSADDERKKINLFMMNLGICPPLPPTHIISSPAYTTWGQPDSYSSSCTVVTEPERNSLVIFCFCSFLKMSPAHT